MRRLLLGLAGTLVAGVLCLTPSAAQAETTLCSGSSFQETMACDPGWAANMMFMHWRMYRGHNCTNYVAWRLTRDGVAEPPYLLGNARSWAGRASDHGVPVDGTPEVGAVGTWPGRNHVTYVEQVGPGWLMLSEDSWSLGRYRRYLVHRGERNYPTTFIHFAGRNAIRGPTPTVSGTLLVGQWVTANAGTWSPAKTKLSYQWLRDGVVIKGATSRTHKLTADDAGTNITVSVTGTYPGKLARTASSIATSRVSAGTITSATPEITGTPITGNLLSAVPGSWQPATVTLTYGWYADGEAIPGANQQTWKVSKKRKGKQITVRVTGSGPGFDPVTTESAPTAPVVGKGETVGPVIPGTPVIKPTETMVVGDRITVNPGTWSPAGVRRTVRWLRDGQPLDSPTGTWTYVLSAADVGHRISAEFTGTRRNYAPATARTPETPLVYPRELRPTTAPSITGAGLVGEDLTLSPGVWLPGGTQSVAQWTRDGKPIPGATQATYRLTRSDVRHTIGAELTTGLKDWPVDQRAVAFAGKILLRPQIALRSAHSTGEHRVHLVTNVTVSHRPTYGRMRIFENGKVLSTRTFTRSHWAEFDITRKPGRYPLTLSFDRGPEWLAPVERDIVVVVK